jgi:hypothetical protein
VHSVKVRKNSDTRSRDGAVNIHVLVLRDTGHRKSMPTVTYSCIYTEDRGNSDVTEANTVLSWEVQRSNIGLSVVAFSGVLFINLETRSFNVCQLIFQ